MHIFKHYANAHCQFPKINWLSNSQVKSWSLMVLMKILQRNVSFQTVRIVLHLDVAYKIWLRCLQEFLKRCCCLSGNNTFFSPGCWYYVIHLCESLLAFFFPLEDIILWAGEDKCNSAGIAVPKDNVCLRLHRLAIRKV